MNETHETNEINETNETPKTNEVIKMKETNLVPQNELNLQSVFTSLGMPTSVDEQLMRSAFIQRYPEIGKALVAINNPQRAIEFCQMVDQFYYALKGDKLFLLPELKVVKNAQNPNRFLVGTLQVGQETNSVKSTNFYPLVYFKSRRFWKPYRKGEATELYCGSDSGNHGYWQKDNPYIKDCEKCPFRQWNSQLDGTIVNKPMGQGTSPLCTDTYTFIGVTPKLGSLFQVPLSKQCLTGATRQDKGAQDKLIDFGRIMEPFFPGVAETHPLKKYVSQACIGQVDMTSKWVELSGSEIKDRVTGAVNSARTLCSRTETGLTPEEVLFISIFRKLSIDYVTYTVEMFLNKMSRINSTSSVDTVESTSPSTPSQSDADDLDGIEVYDTN